MTAATTTSDSEARAGPFLRLAPLVAVLAGGLLRLSFVWKASFPLNDGGLFYLMVQELWQAGYRLPSFTAYNGGQIPFAYPPLGLYLAGLVADLGQCSLLDVFRLLPAILSMATIPALYALARDALPTRTAAVGAVLAFALMPGSFAWQIMGGGVTRAPGMLLATLAVQQAYRLYTRRSLRHLLAATVFSAGAVLSHLAMAWAAALGIALLALIYGRSRRGLVTSLLLVAGTLALSSPWWATVIARHGLAPFTAAAGSPEPAYTGLALLATLQLGSEPFFPVLAGLALLGALACIPRRQFLWMGWAAAMFVLDPRTAHTTATLPLALLAGIGIAEVLLPVLTGQRLSAVVIVFLFAHAIVGGSVGPMPVLGVLPAAEREAMLWVAAETPASARFLVITGDGAWGSDRSSEWFPVLAQRVSVATVQGTEWLPGFAERTDRYTRLQVCATQGAECLETWAAEHGVAFTHVYLAKRPSVGVYGRSRPCCSGLEAALHCDAQYRLLYDGPAALVFERNHEG
ncbi:MAG: glycosyltransferase family 39 protein [Anaerolineae bacterium]